MEETRKFKERLRRKDTLVSLTTEKATITAANFFWCGVGSGKTVLRRNLGPEHMLYHSYIPSPLLVIFNICSSLSQLNNLETK